MEKYFYNFRLALESIKANKARAALTALGIIFGVAAVISMLAIGEGTQKELLEQMKLVGVNNIVVLPVVKKDKAAEEDGKAEKKKFSPGLTLLDAMGIKEVLPTALHVSPEVETSVSATCNGRKKQARISGVMPAFFSIQNLKLGEGNSFNQVQMEMGRPVCIIGSRVKKFFFPQENAVGQQIKCGSAWFGIIGVLEPTGEVQAQDNGFGLSDLNDGVFVPLQTFLLRVKNRGLITESKLKGGGGGFFFFSGDMDQPQKKEDDNPNQLDKIVVQVQDTKYLSSSASIISRLIKRRHNEVEDFEVKIPELLLRQQQATKDKFNFLLAAIAGISLLVGGIGIMNIMLASILERIREIGIRLSIGATKKDIASQFIIEALLLCVAGGIAGILFGVLSSALIQKFLGYTTIVSFYSVLVSFIVSAGVGIIFGFFPAKKAASQDPVTCLRYE